MRIPRLLPALYKRLPLLNESLLLEDEELPDEDLLGEELPELEAGVVLAVPEEEAVVPLFP